MAKEKVVKQKSKTYYNRFLGEDDITLYIKEREDREYLNAIDDMRKDFINNVDSLQQIEDAFIDFINANPNTDYEPIAKAKEIFYNAVIEYRKRNIR